MKKQWMFIRFPTFNAVVMSLRNQNQDLSLSNPGKHQIYSIQMRMNKTHHISTILSECILKDLATALKVVKGVAHSQNSLLVIRRPQSGCLFLSQPFL